MVNYQEGKIYTIRSHQTDKVYVGSTCVPLSKRLHKHKGYYKAYHNGKHNFLTSYDIVHFDDCYIELHENFPCESKEQLHKREGEVIRSLECVNKTIPGRTIEEWREEHKEEMSIYLKQYREDNKEKIAGYKKKYDEANKEKIAERGKQYAEENKEKIAEYYRKYAAANKEKIAAYNKEWKEHKKLEKG